MSKRKFYAKRAGKKKTTPAIWIDGKRITVGVTERMKTVYYRMERRERYLEERDINNGVVHASDFYYEDEETQEQKLFVSEDCVQEDVEWNLASEKLKQVIELLTEKEKLIIHEIYFENKTQREVAKLLGISQPALRKQHIRIVNKLKTFLV